MRRQGELIAGPFMPIASDPNMTADSDHKSLNPKDTIEPVDPDHLQISSANNELDDIEEIHNESPKNILKKPKLSNTKFILEKIFSKKFIERMESLKNRKTRHIQIDPKIGHKVGFRLFWIAIFVSCLMSFEWGYMNLLKFSEIHLLSLVVAVGYLLPFWLFPSIFNEENDALKKIMDRAKSQKTGDQPKSRRDSIEAMKILMIRNSENDKNSKNFKSWMNLKFMAVLLAVIAMATYMILYRKFFVTKCNFPHAYKNYDCLFPDMLNHNFFMYLVIGFSYIGVNFCFDQKEINRKKL